jgi:quercetin dioxygenase-like cupin family protein
MKMLAVAILTIAAATPTMAQTGGASPSHPADHQLNLKFQDVEWKKIIPELGAGSPEISILRVDPKSQATQLMIRVPKNFHVPRHWHSANETHTVISGTFIVEHGDGKREELGPGSFNYVPSKTIHQAWTKSDEGSLLFITVDAAWHVNWVDAPPMAKK